MEEKIDLFTEYVNNFNINDNNIKLKYYHTLRVVGFCENISKSLNLNKQDIYLSKTIGLLHDIARFHQWDKYHTFDDLKSIDHGDYALEIMIFDNKIRNILSDVDSNIVKEAIKYHNKFNINQSLDERTKLFCKIIRDADKLDILDLYIQKQIGGVASNSIISPKIYEELLNNRCLNCNIIETLLDSELVKVGLFFDFNFSYSYKYIKDNNIVNLVLDSIIKNNPNELEKLEKIREKTLIYMKERG